MRRFAVLISGRGSNMGSLLEAAHAPGFPAKPVLVAANRADAAGLQIAAAQGIPSRVVEHRNWGGDREGFERALSEELEAAGAEFVVLAGFMRRLTPWFVGRWRDRIINIHPSLLPSFPGLDTHRRALAAGCAIHGCTVHVVRDAVDEGPILGQAALRILPSDNPETLAARVLRLEHRLYPRVLAAWAEGRIGVEGESRRGDPVALLEGQS